MANPRLQKNSHVESTKVIYWLTFQKSSQDIHKLFEDISDLNFIFTQLQLSYRKSLKPHKSVIIFDEIQKQPLARQAIKSRLMGGMII